MAVTAKKDKANKLTPKQRAFVQHLIAHPKQSATKAALATYGSEDKPPAYSSAREIARQNMTKPSVVTELSKYNNMIEDALLNTVNDWKQEDNSRKREIAMDIAKFVHDKVNGRATQKVETTSEVVSININLTGSDAS